MIRHLGMKRAVMRWKSPGSSLRWERSPVAPNSTTTCGAFGPTPAGIFDIAKAPELFVLSRLRHCAAASVTVMRQEGRFAKR